jgi:hypothetical protein
VPLIPAVTLKCNTTHIDFQNQTDQAFPGLDVPWLFSFIRFNFLYQLNDQYTPFLLITGASKVDVELNYNRQGLRHKMTFSIFIMDICCIRFMKISEEAFYNAAF